MPLSEQPSTTTNMRLAIVERMLFVLVTGTLAYTMYHKWLLIDALQTATRDQMEWCARVCASSIDCSRVCLL